MSALTLFMRIPRPAQPSGLPTAQWGERPDKAAERLAYMAARAARAAKAGGR